LFRSSELKYNTRRVGNKKTARAAKKMSRRKKEFAATKCERVTRGARPSSCEYPSLHAGPSHAPVRDLLTNFESGCSRIHEGILGAEGYKTIVVRSSKFKVERSTLALKRRTSNSEP